MRTISLVSFAMLKVGIASNAENVERLTPSRRPTSAQSQAGRMRYFAFSMHRNRLMISVDRFAHLPDDPRTERRPNCNSFTIPKTSIGNSRRRKWMGRYCKRRDPLSGGLFCLVGPAPLRTERLFRSVPSGRNIRRTHGRRPSGRLRRAIRFSTSATRSQPSNFVLVRSRGFEGRSAAMSSDSPRGLQGQTDKDSLETESKQAIRRHDVKHSTNV